MKCDQFQDMMADALGDELSASQRQSFNAHLRICDACRREHAGLSATLDDLRRVGRTPTVNAHREGDRLVIDLAATGAAATRMRESSPWQSALRYAAVILLAFAAGYTTSRGGARREASPNPAPYSIAKAPAPAPSSARPDGTTFETALIKAHERNPGASDLAKCMRALLGSAR